jgi:ferredoxin
VRVRVDPSLCVGHGRCYDLAPEVYGEDARGHCRVLLADVPPDLEKQARAGVENCPERALEIVEE